MACCFPEDDMFDETLVESNLSKPMQRTFSEFVVPSLKTSMAATRPGVLTSSHASSTINSPLARFTFTDQEASIGLTPSAYRGPAIDASVPKPKPFDRMALLGENSPTTMRVKTPLVKLQSPASKTFSPVTRVDSPDVRLTRGSRFAPAREAVAYTAAL